MRKLKIFIKLMLLLIPFNIYSQRNIPAEVRYNNNFNPTITATPMNESDKIITSIQFIVVTKLKNANFNNPSAYKYENKIVNVTIPPHTSKQITIKFNNEEGYDYSGLMVDKVRYSDGTVKNY